MWKRKTAILTAAFLAVAALLLLLLGHDHEPRYRHHSLSHWTSIYLQGYPPVMAPPAHQELANEAIRHIGTNAIPHLLRWLEYDPYPHLEKVDAFSLRLPPGIRTNQSFIQVAYRDSKLRRSHAAGFALAALGEQAQPAIPELVRVVAGTNRYLSLRAAIILQRIGKPAAPALLALLQDPNPSIRAAAHEQLQWLTNAPPK